ncbi:MAG: esterase-like activity of phytase family protein [Erythrobacter sp.]
MRSKRRLLAALAVALMCAPGTWLRSAPPTAPAADLAAIRIADPRATGVPGWQLAGVWHLVSSDSQFGGFSALLDRGEAGFTAFSDRGWRLDFASPEGPARPPRLVRMFPDQGLQHRFFDLEAAVRDPASGTFWVASENDHAIHRFAADGTPQGRRELRGRVPWLRNSGIEAMVRLGDGRFVVLPEGQREGLIFPRDPVEGGKPARFAITVPEPGYDITDAAVLPDGRLMVVLRKLLSPLSDGWPPFASLIAVGDMPQAGGDFRPRTVLRLAGVVPPENYEGLALQARPDGRIAVWLIADDNISVFQRTLLAKFIFTP